MTTVSVVIPTYNRRDFLRRTISPLLEDSATTEVVVVVDGCSDGSIELLKEWAQSEPRLRPVFQENTGQAAARQHGIEVASGDVVVILDDDVIASTNMVTAHAKQHSSTSHNVVLGYMPTEIPSPRAAGQVPTLLYASDYEKVCQSYDLDPQQIFKSFWAGNCSMRRDDALRVGFTNEGVLSYHEDQQFGFRCQRADLNPVFDRAILAKHFHVRPLTTFAQECKRQGAARVVLQEQYPDLAGDIDPRDELPQWFAAVVTVLSLRFVEPVATKALIGMGTFAGRARVFGLEMLCGRILRQVTMLAAMRAAGF
jgi:hypothetical protein